jgi:hypothetical protein
MDWLQFFAPTPSSLPATAARTEQLQHAGDYSANTAVFLAWLPVETALLNLAKAANVLQANVEPWMAQRTLLKRGLIDVRTHEAIRDLRSLRNLAVHPSEGRLISKEEADRFTKLAEKIAAVLEDKRQML